MKVLYIVGGDGKGYGSEKIAISLIDGLSSKGIEFIVITSKGGVVKEYCDTHHIENYIVDSYLYMYKKSKIRLFDNIKRILQIVYGFIKDSVAIYKLTKLTDLSGVDLIHTNITRTMMGGIISRRYKIPHIWHIQELYTGHYDVYPLMFRQTKWMNIHCDKFIAISDTVKNSWIDSGLDSDKLIRVYNGIDTKLVSKRVSAEDGHLKILMVGDICDEKGQLFVVSSISKIVSNVRRSIIIDLYGDVREEYRLKIEKIAKKADVNVNIKGYCNNIVDILQNYDIGINYSKGEGFGLSTLEYMLAGLYVIVSNRGANTELICEDAGSVVEYGDEKALADEIIRVFKNKSLINIVGTKAHNIASKKFAIDAFYNNVFDIYYSFYR